MRGLFRNFAPSLMWFILKRLFPAWSIEGIVKQGILRYEYIHFLLMSQNDYP